MRKTLFAAVLVTGLALSANALAFTDSYGDAASRGARETVKGDVQDTLENARAAYDEMGEVTYKKTIPKPEDVQGAASSCLDGIANADFGFGLGVPSVSSLFNSACNAINSEVSGYLDNVRFDLSDDYTRIGAGLGQGSAPGNSINYDQVGEGIADELWNNISRDNQW